MIHDVGLIATIAAGFGLALIFGYFAVCLKMSPMVGYLLAGIVLGPYTPGFVGNLELLKQLAEIGVMLLMFGIGLRFSVAELLAVKRIAIPGAVAQILVATMLGAVIALHWGWEIGAALIFGLCLSVASTVVLLRALEAKGLLDSINGHIAVGWLIVEDLVMVFVLVLLPVIADFLGEIQGAKGTFLGHDLWISLGLTIGKVTVFITLMLVVGRKIFPKILWLTARTGSQELFTLCVIATAIGVAFGAAVLFDVSFALGAFFSGMMLRESQFSRKAAIELLPLKDAFAVLFFISVGMLFDPNIAFTEPMKLLMVLAIIVLGKMLIAVILVLAFRYPLNTALTVGVSLAQIGEFSFILAGLGVSLELLSLEGQSLILAGALISIASNSLMFSAIEPIHHWARKYSSFVRELDSRPDPLAELPLSTQLSNLTEQVVLVGYGSIGYQISQALEENHIPYVVADKNREVIERLREQDYLAVCGNAVTPAVLIQAHIARASMLIVTIKETFNAHKIAQIAKTLNPHIHIILRSHNAEEADFLRQEGLGTVLVDEQELARAMTHQILTFLK